MMNAIEKKRGALDIAKRALQTCSQIFRYAIAHGLAKRNPRRRSGKLRLCSRQL